MPPKLAEACSWAGPSATTIVRWRLPIIPICLDS